MPGRSAAPSPAPSIRVKLGDTVNVHLTNTGQMSHSIDFHASQTAMNHQMVEIKPGATFTYTYKADYAGVWMYHCGTAPALHHIANGMFGMVIVEPKGGLPKVDQEFAFVQSEWYLGAQGEPRSYAKANQTAAAPDFVVFNGVANQYKDNPVAIETGKRVRVFVLDAGPVHGQLLPRGRHDLRPGHEGGRRAQARQRRQLGLPGRRPLAGAGRDHRVHRRPRTGCTRSSPTPSTSSPTARSGSSRPATATRSTSGRRSPPPLPAGGRPPRTVAGLSVSGPGPARDRLRVGCGSCRATLGTRRSQRRSASGIVGLLAPPHRELLGGQAAEVVEEVGAVALQDVSGGLEHPLPVRDVHGDDRATVRDRPLVDEEVGRLVHQQELEHADDAREGVRPRSEPAEARRGRLAPSSTDTVGRANAGATRAAAAARGAGGIVDDAQQPAPWGR